jgi:hypothetical protein
VWGVRKKKSSIKFCLCKSGVLDKPEHVALRTLLIWEKCKYFIEVEENKGVDFKYK